MRARYAAADNMQLRQKGPDSMSGGRCLKTSPVKKTVTRAIAKSVAKTVEKMGASSGGVKRKCKVSHWQPPDATLYVS